MGVWACTGKVAIKEFTPTKVGKYRFSCWMGMVTGVIEVVDENGSNTQTNSGSTNGQTIVESGAKGCGCGGGNSSGGSKK